MQKALQRQLREQAEATMTWEHIQAEEWFVVDGKPVGTVTHYTAQIWIASWYPDGPLGDRRELGRDTREECRRMVEWRAKFERRDP